MVLSFPILVLVAKDVLRNGKRYYLHKTHVVTEIRQCCAYKTKVCMSLVFLFAEGNAKLIFAFKDSMPQNYKGLLKIVCHEM